MAHIHINVLDCTLSVTIYCTIKGDIIEKILENPLVSPMRTPEWFGDKSKWFTWNPHSPPAEIPPLTIRSATDNPGLSLGMKPTKPKLIAGTIVPKSRKFEFIR